MVEINPNMSAEEMYDIASKTSDHEWHVNEFLPGLIEALTNTDPKYPALEIGHRLGGSTLLTAWYLKKEGKRRPLVSVDFIAEEWWDFYKNVLPYIKAWDIPYTYYLMDQNEFTEKYLGSYEFGFIYHDGNHSAEKVIPDLERLVPRLTPGGVLVVDDIHFWTTPNTQPTFGLEIAKIETSDVHGHTGIASDHIGFWRRPR